MGYYINHLSNGELLKATGKAMRLIEDGGREILKPKTFVENLVCVVENMCFDAAGYIYSEAELKAFSDPDDYRRKWWIIYPNAAKLSGYSK